jgi:hypothetical protein
VSIPTIAADASLAELLTRHRAFWDRTPVDRPLLDVVHWHEGPRLANTILTPDMLDVDAFVDGIKIAAHEGSLIQGDLFRIACPYTRVPWMEALIGSPIQVVDDEAAGMWPRPRPFDWRDTQSLRVAASNRWFSKLLAYTRELTQQWDVSYLPTHTLMRGPIDMASAILGDVRLGLAFNDYPDELAELLSVCADNFIDVGKAQWQLIDPFEGGYCSFYGIWAPGHPQRLQVDSASQLSPATYRMHVAPHDRRITEAFEFSSIDVHSGGTLHLVDDMLEMPALRAISVSIDPYESAPRLTDLVPVFALILERKSLVLNGPMTRSELNLLVDNLSPTGLAIRTRLTD